MGSSTISPYFTIPRLQLRIASTTHYTISWTSCQRTWTSHHTNLHTSLSPILNYYTQTSHNLGLAKYKSLTYTQTSRYLSLTQPPTDVAPTSHLALHKPHISSTPHSNMWTAQGPNLTLHWRHIAWVPQDVNFILYVESHYINFNFTIASTSCTPTPHCFTIHGVLQIGAGRSHWSCVTNDEIW